MANPRCHRTAFRDNKWPAYRRDFSLAICLRSHAMGFALSKKAARRILVVASVCFVITLGMLIHRIVHIPTYVNVAEVVERHLEAAKQEAAAGLETQIDIIHQFFVQAKGGTRPFAEDALGWGSKWEFMTGFIFYDDRHREYLEE